MRAGVTKYIVIKEFEEEGVYFHEGCILLALEDFYYFLAYIETVDKVSTGLGLHNDFILEYMKLNRDACDYYPNKCWNIYKDKIESCCRPLELLNYV